MPGSDLATLTVARRHAARGEDAAATQAYLDILACDDGHFDALCELGALALSGGHRQAAMTLCRQAVLRHPDHPISHVNLANLLLEDGDGVNARIHYEAALTLNPDFAPAHQGMARILGEAGEPAAEAHWQRGFAGRAIVTNPFRGQGAGIPLVLLVAARGGNIPTRLWLDDQVFAITALYADVAEPDVPLPADTLVLNAIGDADLCRPALKRAESLLRGHIGPVINPPKQVAATGRVANASRLAAIPGVVTSATRAYGRAGLLAATDLAFPLLLRAEGFHTGRHFVRVETDSALADAVAGLPGDRLLTLAPLDARSADGWFRKYRVICVEGNLYPLHLAISSNWKVHYFTADMAAHKQHRAEEERFLNDMQGVLGPRALAALAGITDCLGLDYAGIDFAVSADDSVLLFEANATMVVSPPDPDPIWAYRRPAARAILAAIRAMLLRRVPIPP